jgi:hypothetical protein
VAQGIGPEFKPSSTKKKKFPESLKGRGLREGEKDRRWVMIKAHYIYA